MKKNRLFTYFFLLFLITSCSSLSDAGKVLRNEKTKTTDEFLVKKREPLSLPPEYKKLPMPDSLEKKSKKSNVTKILKIEEENSSSKKSTTVEQSIINQIGK